MSLTKYTPSLRVWNQDQEIAAQFDCPFMDGFTMTVLTNSIFELVKWTDLISEPDVCYPNLIETDEQQNGILIFTFTMRNLMIQ